METHLVSSMDRKKWELTNTLSQNIWAWEYRFKSGKLACKGLPRQFHIVSFHTVLGILKENYVFFFVKIFAEIWDLTLAVPALKLIIQLSYIQGLGWNSIIICGQSSLIATALSFLQVTLFLFYESRCHIIEIRFAVLCEVCLYHPVSSFALTKLCVICFDRKTHSIQNAEQFPSQNKTLLPQLKRIFTLKEQKFFFIHFSCIVIKRKHPSEWCEQMEGGRVGQMI